MRVLRDVRVGSRALAIALGVTAMLAAPSLARAAQGTIIAVQGPDQSLDVYSRADASSGWNESVVAGGGTTASAPTAARFQNAAGQPGTLIAAASPNGAIDLYANVDGQSAWTSSQVAGTGTAFSIPVLLRFDNDQGEIGSELVEQGPNNSLSFGYAIDGQPWTFSELAGNGTEFGTPAAARFSSSWGETGTAIAALGPSDSLDFSYNVDGSPKWNEAMIAGDATTTGDPAIARFDNASGATGTLVAAPGPSDSLDFYDNIDGDSTWNGSTVAPAGSTFGDPAMVRFENATGEQGTLLAAPGASDSLDFYSNVDGDPSWNSSTIAGAGTTFSAPAMTRTVADNGAQGTAIASEGSDDSLELYTNSDGVPSWSADQVAGPGEADSEPAILRADDLPVTTTPAGTGTTALPTASRHRPRRVRVAMQFTWRYDGRTTRLVSVRIGRLPRGGTVTFAWRAGAHQRRALARSAGVRRLERRLHGHLFIAGERIDVRVAAPRRIAQRDEILIRAGGLPRMRALTRH